MKKNPQVTKEKEVMTLCFFVKKAEPCTKQMSKFSTKCAFAKPKQNNNNKNKNKRNSNKNHSNNKNKNNRNSNKNTSNNKNKNNRNNNNSLQNRPIPLQYLMVLLKLLQMT